MAEVISIDADGDLLVTAGEGNSAMTAKASIKVLQLASPVFKAMLGPSFSEGQLVDGEHRPLKLPGDNPHAFLNLLQILHYRPNETDRTEQDWLQKLFIVCDKYGCTRNLSAYLRCEIQGSTQLSDVDKCIILGLIGDRALFRVASDGVVRMPEAQAMIEAHKDLLQLAPEGMLDRMKKYRLEARNYYRHKTHDLLISMYNHSLIDEYKLCTGLRLRADLFYSKLLKSGVLTSNVTTDCHLPDMEDICEQPLIDPDGRGAAQIDWYNCNNNLCDTCQVDVEGLIVEVVKDLTFGTPEHARVCLECFQERTCIFLYECGKHSAPPPQ